MRRNRYRPLSALKKSAQLYNILIKLTHPEKVQLMFEQTMNEKRKVFIIPEE